MINTIKNIIGWEHLVQFCRFKLISLKLPKESTVLVHIGKCGGRTVKEGIKNAVNHANLHKVHIRKPLYRKDLKYIIVAREPISRLVSAFQWRFKLVVATGEQKDRFQGEYEVLVKYHNLKNLAEALYDEQGNADLSAHQDIRKIHHIREDIAFYLHDLLNQCCPNQIIAVLMQENLNDDIYRVFGYKNELNIHRNPSSDKDKTLSDRAIKNLMRFFADDYQALTKLCCWGKIEPNVLKAAL